MHGLNQLNQLMTAASAKTSDLFVAGAGQTANNSWSLENFLQSATEQVDIWIKLFVTLLGVVAVGLAIWQFVSGLMSHGKKQVNWGVAAILLIVGGTLSVSSGYGLVKDIASGGKKTIEDLGSGAIQLIDPSSLDAIGNLFITLPF